jgi:uncharacterized membrane protein
MNKYKENILAVLMLFLSVVAIVLLLCIPVGLFIAYSYLIMISYNTIAMAFGLTLLNYKVTVAMCFLLLIVVHILASVFSKR